MAEMEKIDVWQTDRIAISIGLLETNYTIISVFNDMMIPTFLLSITEQQKH